MITVYELIQELSRYNADTEVRFNFAGKFDTDAEAEFDRDNENDVQDVTVTAHFDDNLEYEDIDNYESGRFGKPHIQINLSY